MTPPTHSFFCNNFFTWGISKSLRNPKEAKCIHGISEEEIAEDLNDVPTHTF